MDAPLGYLWGGGAVCVFLTLLALLKHFVYVLRCVHRTPLFIMFYKHLDTLDCTKSGQVRPWVVNRRSPPKCSSEV